MAEERSLRQRGAACLLLAALLATACDTREVYLVPGSPGAAQGGSGGADVGLADAAPGVGGLPLPDAGSSPDARPRPDADAGCTELLYQPEPQPLGIYLMVDQSSSMDLAWAPVTAALEQFINESGRLSGVSVGIQYFIANPPPLLVIGWENTLCDSAAYVTPDVPIAPLPRNSGPLVESLSLHGPSTLYRTWLELAAALIFVDDSPTDAALAGAVEGARAWHAANSASDPQAVVVLVTDAVPGLTTSPVCSATLAATAAVAQAGYRGTPSVATYVLGVGDRLADLDAIAAAGGTGRAHLVQSNASADILAELSGLRSAALPCRFAVDPGWLQSDLVNVELTSAFGTTTFQRVADAAACPGDAAVLAWFSSGTAEVTLCPATCSAVRSTPQSALEVVYGCARTQ